jgi:hypothetical protein
MSEPGENKQAGNSEPVQFLRQPFEKNSELEQERALQLPEEFVAQEKVLGANTY